MYNLFRALCETPPYIINYEEGEKKRKERGNWGKRKERDDNELRSRKALNRERKRRDGYGVAYLYL